MNRCSVYPVCFLFLSFFWREAQFSLRNCEKKPSGFTLLKTLSKSSVVILILCLFVVQLAQEFSRFGSVDVKILDSQHALVAVAQHRR